MNIEKTDLESRARRHAALAEPIRLRMVDLLTLGDLSPSELRHELDVPSNLVAHHLNVLETAGMIRRSRSEGDGRRTYVQLEPDSLRQLGPSAQSAVARVVFVCTANSARSQFAALLWNEVSDVPAVSAGTHPAERIATGAVRAARANGRELPDVAPQCTDAVVQETDFIITVCDSAHEELSADAAHWSIPDPVAVGTDHAFAAAFDDVAERVKRLAPRIRPPLPFDP